MAATLPPMPEIPAGFELSFSSGVPVLRPQSDGASRLAYRRASAVTPSRPAWLWPRWLCRGVLVLLVGRQGAGKSTWISWLVARLTTGNPLPDGTRVDPLTCALLSLEEPDERTVARLQAAGADLDKIILLGDVVDTDDEGREVRRPWHLPADAGALEHRLVEQGIGLVAVDGLGYSVTGDSHNYAVVGAALASLAGVAERTGCVIVGLTHPPKGASDPLAAAIGSVAWSAIPRITWLLGRDPDDEVRRVIRVAKTNYQEPDQGIAFSIAGDERWEVGYVTGIEASDVTAEALAAASVPAEERTEREEARELLRAVLANGPVETGEVMRLALEAGLSERTVKRARADLGVKAIASRDSQGHVTGWTLALGHGERREPGDQPPGHSPPFGPLGPVGTVAVTRGFTHHERVQGAQGAQRAAGTPGDDVERLVAVFTAANGDRPVEVEDGA